MYVTSGSSEISMRHGPLQGRYLGGLEAQMGLLGQLGRRIQRARSQWKAWHRML